jgi:hypothetical protein
MACDRGTAWRPRLSLTALPLATGVTTLLHQVISWLLECSQPCLPHLTTAQLLRLLWALARLSRLSRQASRLAWEPTAVASAEQWWATLEAATSRAPAAAAGAAAAAAPGWRVHQQAAPGAPAAGPAGPAAAAGWQQAAPGGPPPLLVSMRPWELALCLWSVAQQQKQTAEPLQHTQPQQQGSQQQAVQPSVQWLQLLLSCIQPPPDPSERRPLQHASPVRGSVRPPGAFLLLHPPPAAPGAGQRRPGTPLLAQEAVMLLSGLAALRFKPSDSWLQRLLGRLLRLPVAVPTARTAAMPMDLGASAGSLSSPMQVAGAGSMPAHTPQHHSPLAAGYLPQPVHSGAVPPARLTAAAVPPLKRRRRRKQVFEKLIIPGPQLQRLLVALLRLHTRLPQQHLQALAAQLKVRCMPAASCRSVASSALCASAGCPTQLCATASRPAAWVGGWPPSAQLVSCAWLLCQLGLTAPPPELCSAWLKAVQVSSTRLRPQQLHLALQVRLPGGERGERRSNSGGC